MKYVSDLLVLSGIASIGYGVSLISIPISFITVGVLIGCCGLAVAYATRNDP